ncbi:MAG: DUF1737 domain-containing protein [Microbacteriaceae bacterium]
MSTPRKPAAAKAAAPATKTVAKPATRATAKPVARTAAKVAAKPATRVAKPAPKNKAVAAPKAVISTEKRFKMLTGIDDSSFCQKVSDHLDAGYELYGSPTMTSKGAQIFVGQAVVLKKKPTSKKKGKK